MQRDFRDIWARSVSCAFNELTQEPAYGWDTPEWWNDETLLITSSQVVKGRRDDLYAWLMRAEVLSGVRAQVLAGVAKPGAQWTVKPRTGGQLREAADCFHRASQIAASDTADDLSEQLKQRGDGCKMVADAAGDDSGEIDDVANKVIAAVYACQVVKDEQGR